MKHWFWHAMGIFVLMARDQSGSVSDADYAWYKAFMKKHGFNSAP
jgi:hypothetical protein